MGMSPRLEISSQNITTSEERPRRRHTGPIKASERCSDSYWHVAPTHTSPAAHAAPHAPQFARSVSVSTHVPPQSVSPAWHDSSHCPVPLHTSPAAHAAPHAPQCARSVFVSTHRPLHSVKPA